jgi:hypothetical protein
MGEGMTLEKLQVIIEAQTKPYRDEVEKLKRQTTSAASHVERQTAKMKKSFGGLGKVVASVLGVGAIVAFAKSCIDLGSDLAEVQNVVDVSFGKMSGAVDAFAKNAITQFGLSELTAKKYMGTYGAMAKAFGVTGEAGYQMSAAITGLTGDVASFYNLSTDEAYTKLKSIFTGETESLKDLGVVMTQTALDQYALNNGFGKTTAKMTEQEKVMLRYQFVMSSLADASGDFARTSTSWANQVRVLSLQFESLKATIGQGLINAFTPVIRVINTILAKLQTLAAYFKAFTVALFGDAGGSSDIADSMDSAADSSGAVAGNMDKAAKSAKKMKDYTLGIDELNVLDPNKGSGSGAGGGGSLDFGDMSGELFGEVTVNQEIEAAVERLRKAIDAIKELVKPTTDALKRLWNEGLSLLGKFTWTALEDFWNYFLVPLGSWALGEGFPRFIDITNDFLKTINWEAINEALRNFWEALEPFAEKVGEGLLDFYEDLSKVGAAFINTVVPGGLNALADALNKIDSDQAKAIGYGLGVIATSILTFKITKSILDFFDKLKGVILAAGGASTFGITLTLSLIASTGISWASALDLLDRYENGTDEEKKEIEASWDKNKQDSVDKNKWGMGNRYGQMAESANAYKNDNAYKKQFDYLKSMPGEVKQWFNQNLKDTKDWLDALNEQREKESSDFQTWIEDKKSNAKQNWEEIQTWWDNTIGSWWDEHVAPWFTTEKWLGLYESVKTSLKTKWDETVAVWISDIQNWWNTHVSPWFTAERWSQLYNDIKVQLKTKWDSTAVEWGSGIKSWWNQHVSPWFTPERWSQLYQNVKVKLKETWDNTVGEWAINIQTWWDKHVATWFTAKKWLDVYKSVKESLGTTWTNTVNDWKKNIGDWWANDVEKWFKLETWIDMMKRVPDAFKETFKGAVNAAVDQLNRLIDWLNDKLNFSFDGLEILGEEIIPAFSVQLFTIPHIPQFATGGFPEDGLFMANHGELVGKFANGRTAVANNDQITQGIKEAVIEGMSVVMASYSGNSEPITIETHVDMDGRTIVKQTDKVQSRKGFNFRNPQTV